MTDRKTAGVERGDVRSGLSSQDSGPSLDGVPVGEAMPRGMFSADEIYQRVSATAVHEFQRTPRMLWFSGLAAGLSIGLCFLGRMVLGGGTGRTGEPLGDLLFPLGFIVVVLGRYQLFTENTLTPITLVLTRIASLPALLRLWSVVLAANVVGAIVIGSTFAIPGAVPTAAVEAGISIAEHVFETPLREVFVRAVLAGGLVASMVWMVHAMYDSAGRLLVIYMLAVIMPLAGMFHCVTSLVEVVFGVVKGVGGIGQALGFFLATTAGNIVGGVVLVATINYGQTRDRRAPNAYDRELSWREFFLGYHPGRRGGDAVAPELQHD